VLTQIREELAPAIVVNAGGIGNVHRNRELQKFNSAFTIPKGLKKSTFQLSERAAKSTITNSKSHKKIINLF
jgi:hypothetical protein